MPSDHKKKISEESKVAPGRPTVMADKPAPVPTRSGDQVPRKEADEQIMGAALQTTSAGQDYMRGIQSILNSVEKKPLTLWRKEVSNFKTINHLETAGLVLVRQTFLIINISTVCYTWIFINLYHRWK